MEIKSRNHLIISTFLQVLSVLWKLYSGLILILTLLLFYPIHYYLLKDESRHAAGFRMIRFHSALILLLIGVRPRIKFEGKLPEGPFIICPNHTSYLDILLLYIAFKKYFIFIGKRELGTDLFFGLFFARMNILVNRESGMDGMRALNRAASEMKKGTSIVIFPEGTIPAHAPDLMPFKNGPFLLAIREKVPIVPVSFLNVYKLLQIGAFLRRRGKPGIAHIVINEAIETKDLNNVDLVSLRERVYQTIDNSLKKHYAHRR